MPKYTCPTCGGGFANPSGRVRRRCPWCGQEFNDPRLQQQSVGTSLQSIPVTTGGGIGDAGQSEDDSL